jgi:hypothetical protein
MDYLYDDGGGPTGIPNCITRAISIASGLPYKDVLKRVTELGEKAAVELDKRSREAWGVDPAPFAYMGDPEKDGVPDEAVEDYLRELGFEEFSAGLGSNPMPTTGRLVVKLRNPRDSFSENSHFTAMIDNVVHDTWDCRGSTVERYWLQTL